MSVQDRWRPWTAPLALVGGLGVAVMAELVIALLASAIAGASIQNPPGWETIIASVAQDIAFVGVAVYFAATVAPPTQEQFGLRPAPLWRSVWMVAGGYAAFLVFTALWTLALGVSTHEKVLQQLGANTSSLGLALAAFFTCVFAPICEELFFRGYFFRALRNWHGVWPAALITGLVFGGVHVGSAPVADLVPLAFLGVTLCLLYEWTGSLYVCISLHALNNSIAFGDMESWTLLGILAMVLAVLAAVAGVLLLIARVRPAQ